MHIQIMTNLLFIFLFTTPSFASPDKECSAIFHEAENLLPVIDDKELLLRIASHEPDIFKHMVNRIPFFSKNEKFFDPNINTIFNFRDSQENAEGFDFVTLYRGLNNITIEEISGENRIDKNIAIWLSPSESLAYHYAAGNYRMHKNSLFGIVAEVKVPRFLVNWNSRSIDGSVKTKTDNDWKYIYLDKDEAEAFIDRRSINDWRNFIVSLKIIKSKREASNTGSMRIEHVVIAEDESVSDSVLKDLRAQWNSKK